MLLQKYFIHSDNSKFICIYTQHTLNLSMPNNITDVKTVCTYENLNIILDHS
jgi:hypothetical protein